MSRLFEIVLLLLEKGKLTARELSEYFEVSQRTILRDLDKLLVSGVPIITHKGYQGGISINKNYQMDTTLITEEERQSILDGLRALDSVSALPLLPDFMRRLLGYDNYYDIMDIDLSSWYGTTLINKIEDIKRAIHNNHKITFVYYSNKGEQSKKVSPHKIIFRWSSWYVLGICDVAKEFRLYKMNRMDQIVETGEIFERQEYSPREDCFEEVNYILKASFHPKVKFRLIDEYGVGCYTKKKDKLFFEKEFTNKEYMISWILSYGKEVEVLEPKEVRQEIKEIIKNMEDLYEYDI